MFGIASQSFRIGMRPSVGGVVVIANPSNNGIANLLTWYNADLGTSASGNFNQNLASGDDITQWKDRSVFARNLNQSGNATFKPNWIANQTGLGNTFGVVRYNGTAESMSINPTPWLQSLSGFSLFIVAKATTVGVTTRTITATNTGGFQISHNSSNWSVGAASCVGISTITGIGDTSKFNIYSLLFDGSGIGNTARLKFRYNKIDQALTYTGTASTITSASASTYYVGVGSAGNSQFFAGDIAEIVLYGKALNTSEINQIETYLSSHWNL